MHLNHLQSHLLPGLRRPCCISLLLYKQISLMKFSEKETQDKQDENTYFIIFQSRSGTSIIFFFCFLGYFYSFCRNIILDMDSFIFLSINLSPEHYTYWLWSNFLQIGTTKSSFRPDYATNIKNIYSFVKNIKHLIHTYSSFYLLYSWLNSYENFNFSENGDKIILLNQIWGDI